MRTTNSSTGTTTRFLMLEVVKMKKDNQFKYGVTIEAKVNNGMLFTLTKQRVHNLRALTKTLVSM
jgi:hypothetical protein